MLRRFYWAGLPAWFALSVSLLPAQSPSLSDRSSSRSILVTTTMNNDNPFLVASNLPLSAPNFKAIRHEHYMAAFEAGMAQQLKEVQAIAELPSTPTFENTLVALEKSGDILRRVQAVFFNLASSNTDDKIQEIEEKVAPMLAAHSDNIFLNAPLFARVETLWKQKESLKLSEEQQRLLKDYYENFVRSGAKLNEDQKKRIRAINEELSLVETQFQNNLLAITKECAVIVEKVEELDGMSSAELAAAREAAKERGLQDKYLLAITNTTRQPILTSLKNRALRQKVWEASAYRGLGRNGGIDNRPLVLKLAKLRAERSQILGYASHAAFALEDQMAKDPKAAFKMLRDLVPQVVEKTKIESEEITQAMREDGVKDTLQPWDWEYYAERVRKQKYQADENQIKQYFELDGVLKNGVFFAYKKLYGIDFKERFDLPVYHPSVRVFDVLNEDGTVIGLFYADYLHRENKRGGAWMDSFVSQSRLLHQLPVVVNVMNIPKGAEGEPTLVSFDNVTTMFHELGHGVHGLFSTVEFPALSGTSVPRDFVEFPSTFHEDCAIEPSILQNYARHYKTGERIPDELLKKAIAANKFNKGFDTLEYLSAALLDLAWHSLSTDQIPQDVESFEAKVLQEYGVALAAVPPRYKTQYFAHVWCGGYSAGYYAYLWSEVLAADAFAYMKQRGGLSRTNGEAFRNQILSKGGTREVMQQYVDFRNQPPTVEALLIRRGLQKPKEN